MQRTALCAAADAGRWMDPSLFPHAVDILEASMNVLKLNAFLFSVASIKPRCATLPRMPLKSRTYCGECS
jgi:hypothetical protein